MVVSKIRNVVYLILIIIIAIRCVEPYEPEVVEYESTLVVDGFYNDSDSPSTVVISRSFGYEEDTPEYIDNAQVSIEDDQGNIMNLLPAGEGSYQTDPEIHKGEVGRSYRLLIGIQGGSQYASEWETMLAATDIGVIETEFQEREQNDPNALDQKGLQVFLSNEDTENDASFYKWEFEETYQYLLLFSPVIEVAFGSNPGNGEDVTIQIPPQSLQGSTCYKTEKSKNILIGSTEGLSENKISRAPLVFISNETARLYIKYSMLIKQFSITKEQHEYLRKVAEVNQTSGSLFDPIPNELFGNIKNIENDREPVLGFFGVGGIAEKRIFITRADTPQGFGAQLGPRCLSDTIDLDYRSLYNKIGNGSFALSKHDVNLMGTPIGFIITRPQCVYCSASDATNVIPDFW